MNFWRAWKLPWPGKDLRPRLLVFSHETTWSGAPLQLFYLVKWLKDHDWDLTVVVPRTDSPQSGALSSRLAELAIDILPIIDLSVAPDITQLRDLCRSYDFVIANTLVMWGAVEAAHAEGIPVIWYIHETLLLWRLLDLNPQIGSCLKLADLLVFPTKNTARLYQSLTERPIEVVAYGIPALATVPTSGSTKKIHFLLLGSYEERKGQDLFLRAIQRLSIPDQHAGIFQTVGRPLDQAYYERLLRESGETPVTLSEALEHDQAVELLAKCDVLVCASRDETMPLATLEAMSLGKAIVTTSVGGTREWLQNEENALIVPVDDVEALAAAIGRCLKEPELRVRLGRNARRTFTRSFSIDQLGRNFSRLIRDIYSAKS